MLRNWAKLDKDSLSKILASTILISNEGVSIKQRSRNFRLWTQAAIDETAPPQRKRVRDRDKCAPWYNEAL